MKQKNHIPRVPHAFFRWYCKSEKYEELHGDLEEFFYDRVEEVGHFKAQLFYLWNVIRCFQPYAWKIPGSQNSTMGMFKNYYKTSVRSLMKNPVSSFINVFGLAAAIGICVFTYGFGHYIFTVDQFHENKKDVYLATFFANRDGTLQQNGMTPRPFGQMLAQDFSHIQKVCRVDDRNVVLKYGDMVFHEEVRYVDPEFLEMLTFPLKWGHKNTLSDPNSIILSEEMSVKYFGNENPIGASLLMKLNSEKSKTFAVTGVAKKFPDAHSISFDFLINYSNLEQTDKIFDPHDWSKFVRGTLIQVGSPTDIEEIGEGMEKYISLQNEVQRDWAISTFRFEQLETLYSNSSSIRNGISTRGFDSNLKGMIIMSVVALILLLLACFNYINISIVSAAKRLKEIGLRKVIGANRRMVIVQFLAENMLITLFATLLGLLFGGAVIIPWFESLWGFKMDFSLNDMNLWWFLAITMLFTGLISGLYPAFYISRFQVVGILKGSVKFGKKNRLTKVLLGFQLILSCILISSAVMFTQNTGYVVTRSWGYDQDNVLYAKVPDRSAFDQLNEVMLQNPDVIATSGSSQHIGGGSPKKIVAMPDREYEVDMLAVDATYFATMGLNVSTGRAFKEDFQSDKKSIVVNPEFVSNLNLDEPVGQRIKIDSVSYQIVGVIDDFHPHSFENEILPTMFRIADKDDYRYLSIQVREGSNIEVYKDLRTQWISLYPEDPFQGGYQEDVWGSYFEEIGVHGKVWRGIASIAILLASLGLYGLVTLNVSGRVKEFSIRQVLGAQRANIAKTIVKHYVILYTVAIAIGAPISYMAVEFLFDLAYPYHIPMNSFGVIVSVGLMILILMTTISTQVRKISKSNPVEGLKVE
ncbi:MAG: FtsX-like permease family protein [Cyclobacteriaceae bacterium]